MLLLHINCSKNKLKPTMLALGIGIMLIGNFLTAAATETATNESTAAKQQEEKINETPVEVVNKTQKTFKKELKLQPSNETVVVITPPAKDDHTEKLVIIDEKSLVENSGKGVEQQPPVAAQESKGSEKTGLLETVTKEASVQHAQPYQHHINEEFILNDDDMSESLKTGFYFFLILSSAAIVFIVFKIYRLRLSRAERKYGVQGDRSTQELTPLPISIEDGHSDDEDQTLFEVQRQNIRIL